MSEKPSNKISPSFWLSLFFFIVVGVFVVTAAEWGWDTRLFPWAIGIPTLGLGLWQLARDWRGTDIKAAGQNENNSRPQGILDISVDENIPPEQIFRHTIKCAGWIFGFACGIWFLGFMISIPIFVFFYLIYQAEASKLSAFITTGLMTLFVWALFDQVMHLAWPQATILTWLGF